jgi:ABC-2 type transport system ATP-binding protein
MSVESKNVSRWYGDVHAVNDVSFVVGQGEVVGLLGPNGAGKSTMMKIITCFIPQHAGQVQVCGFDVIDQALEVRRHIGYLPENNPLYHDMYIREYLQFVARLYKLGHTSGNRIREVIEVTGLGSELKKKIGTLSKGYRQRVGLAQALVHNPDVLILDEPTSGLDPNQLADIRHLIKQIGKEKTVLLSTHIMQEVEAICDRVIIIHHGKIVADSPTTAIKHLTQTGSMVRITFNKKTSLTLLNAIDGINDITDEQNATYRVFCRNDIDIRPALFHYAVENKLIILEMQQETQSLEQVFRQLTI